MIALRRYRRFASAFAASAVMSFSAGAIEPTAGDRKCVSSVAPLKTSSYDEKPCFCFDTGMCARLTTTRSIWLSVRLAKGLPPSSGCHPPQILSARSAFFFFFFCCFTSLFWAAWTCSVVSVLGRMAACTSCSFIGLVARNTRSESRLSSFGLPESFSSRAFGLLCCASWMNASSALTPVAWPTSATGDSKTFSTRSSGNQPLLPSSRLPSAQPAPSLRVMVMTSPFLKQRSSISSAL
mmetsp:Transcript_10683/g.43800  ORF Transcript_10683/g.43800 Transcript_10683/m.43800 type:complete len:238 (-) Transcript_10683:206-919(-)